MLIVPPFLTAILNGFSVVQAQFTSGIDLVEVYTTVTDRQGQPVTGLTVPDFTVSEDGRPQSITTFAAGDFPLAVAVAIDRSFSMGDRLAVGKSAARAFVGALRPVDQVMIVAVGSETGMTTPLTTDHRAALAAIDRLDRWGTTPLYDAMAAAIDVVEPAKGRRALVLLSDGTDRYSRTSASELLDHARHSNVLIYP
ncbi:MAG: VWA domain-containing protein, partial [Acidobacteria bacterium]|nr:VWA domain-containing protein [Acidobacteriota bacterium]